MIDSSSTFSNGYYNTANQDSRYFAPSWFAGTQLKPRETIDKEILSWLQAALSEGNAYIRSQPAAQQDLTKAIDIVTGEIAKEYRLPNELSKTFVNTIKKDIRENVAILYDIRPTWTYEANSSKVPDWMAQAKMLNQCSRWWYVNTFADEKLKSMLQLGCVQGTGYISPVWKPDFYRLGSSKFLGDIDLKTYPYDSVLPIGINRDFNLQEAYAVVIKDEMDIRRAKMIWGEKAHLIKPDREAGSFSAIKTYAKTALEIMKGAQSPQSSPTVDIYYIYIDDRTINPLTYSIPMGTPGTSWAYNVPYYNQEIPDTSFTSGLRNTKKAGYNDCLLFPNRRLIICTRNVVLYDNTSYWWHGQVPIIKYSPDQWIWSYLGYSLATEALSLQVSSNNMRRAVEDALNLALDPPMMIDEQSVPKNIAERSLRIPGRKFRGRLNMGDFMKPLTNPTNYQVQQAHLEYIREAEDQVGQLIGTPDLKSLNQAKQLPSSDTIEKFFASAGAIVRDMSRSMDKPLLQMADMVRYYIMQFYDAERRMYLMGDSGLTREDFDFDPSSIVPDMLPGETQQIPINTSLPTSMFLSTRMERAKIHCANFTTTITPTSLHQITHIQKKLMYMQSTKVNPFLVDPETLAKELDIPNWGHLEGETILEKVISFQKLQSQLGLQQQFDMGKLQLLLQLLAASASPENQLAQGIQGIGQALSSEAATPPSPTGQPTGRPPSFNAAPQLKQRTDGDVTVQTSR